jgi:putative FmdB family regulatory protein
MPLYDYDCAACGRRFEAIHGVHADPPAACPLCGSGPVRKAIAAPAVHFKGSGWAKKERRSAARSTDTAKDGAEAGTASSSSGSEGGTATTNGTSAESKTPTSKPSGALKASPPADAD